MDWTIGPLDQFLDYFLDHFFLPILILNSSCYILREGWLPILIFQEGGVVGTVIREG